MVDYNSRERRDSVRIKRIVTVRHRLNKRNGKKQEDIWQLSTTEDMSYSGLLFASVLPYKVDDIVELQVVMSGVLFLFNGYGRVVRIHEQKNGYFQVAVKYVDLKVRRRNAKSLAPTSKRRMTSKVSRKS